MKICIYTNLEDIPEDKDQFNCDLMIEHLPEAEEEWGKEGNSVYLILSTNQNEPKEKKFQVERELMKLPWVTGLDGSWWGG